MEAGQELFQECLLFDIVHAIAVQVRRVQQEGKRQQAERSHHPTRLARAAPGLPLVTRVTAPLGPKVAF